MIDGNLLADLPARPGPGQESFATILEAGDLQLERIVSTGQATPEGEWFDQERDEWVLLLAGSAALRFEDESEARHLPPGDQVLIASHRRHRVDWTDARYPTVWLALHFRAHPAAAGR